MNFPSHILFNNVNHRYKAALLRKKFLWLFSIYMDVASYCYFEKGCRTNARSLSFSILFQLQSWIVLRVRTKFFLRNFHVKRVVFEIAVMNIFNNCIAGCSNNNYFPLNERFQSLLTIFCFFNNCSKEYLSKK